MGLQSYSTFLRGGSLQWNKHRTQCKTSTFSKHSFDFYKRSLIMAEDEAQEAFERDNWESMPPTSSLARVHSALMIQPFLKRPQTKYLLDEDCDNTIRLPSTSLNTLTTSNSNFQSLSQLEILDEMHEKLIDTPSSLNRIQSNASDGTSVVITKGDHISPNWYHLTLQKIYPAHTSNMNLNKFGLCPLERDHTMADTELQQTCQMIHKTLNLRHKWVYKKSANNDIAQITENHNIYKYEIIDGITKIYITKENDIECFKGYSFEEYISDLQIIYSLMALAIRSC